MKEKQQFYIGDTPLLEVSTGVFARVVVKKVVDISDRRAFGEYRYVISPVDGRGEMTVTASRLTK